MDHKMCTNRNGIYNGIPFKSQTVMRYLLHWIVFYSVSHSTAVQLPSLVKNVGNLREEPLDSVAVELECTPTYWYIKLAELQCQLWKQLR